MKTKRIDEKRKRMNYKTYIVAMMLLLAISIPAYAEQSEHSCVDKEKDISAPPPNIQSPTQQTTQSTDPAKQPLCSNGKVPKLNNDKVDKEYKDAGKLKKVPNPSPTYTGGAWYDWADSEQSIWNRGVYAVLTQDSPYVDTSYGYHSLAEIGTQASDGDYVEVGWRKARNDYTRLFVFWWNNNIPQCYNGCGWVQYSSYYYPGMILGTDDYGKSYAIEYYNGDWWIWYNNQWIGYYPGSLWNYGFTSGNRGLYYGEVSSAIQRTRTDMGNGYWANNYYAAKITSEEYFTNNWYNSVTSKWASSPDMYSIYSLGSNQIRYGGPGSG